MALLVAVWSKKLAEVGHFITLSSRGLNILITFPHRYLWAHKGLSKINFPDNFVRSFSVHLLRNGWWDGHAGRLTLNKRIWKRRDSIFSSLVTQEKYCETKCFLGSWKCPSESEPVVFLANLGQSKEETGIFINGHGCKITQVSSSLKNY